MDSEAKAKFLQAMRILPVVGSAAGFAGVSRSTAYRWREEDPEFRAAWVDAKEDGLDLLELQAYQLAKATTDAKDSALLKWLLACNRPEQYGDRTRAEIVGAGGAPLEVVLSWNRKPKVTDGSEPSDAPDDPGTSAGAA